jgi:hypothetical protein
MKRWASEEKIYALQNSPSIERLDDTSRVTNKGRELRYRGLQNSTLRKGLLLRYRSAKRKGGRVRLSLPEGMAINPGEEPGTDCPRQYKTGHFFFDKNRTFLFWLDKGTVQD